MRRRGFAVAPLAFAAWGSVWASGCTPDVGACDLPSALEVVYLDTGVAARDDNGVPMYAGQALVHASCSAAGSCHSSAATGALRYGVPHGFDFDLGHRCLGEDCIDDGTAIEDGQRTILRWAPQTLAALDSGAMPPSEIGRAVAAAGPMAVRLGADGLRAIRESAASLEEAGVPLPSIGSRDGREIVRNWLACGAPVVERTESPIGVDPGTACDAPTTTGSCVHRVRVAPVPPEPTFESIYTLYLEPSCAGCHGPGALDRRGESRLDLGEIETAYESLLGDEHGRACGDASARVVPFDAEASLLLDKIGATPACGAPMAGPRGADEGVRAAISEWIARGAAR